MLTTLLSLVVTLGVLIFVHELGHLFAAKLVGIHAPRFSLGFGKKLWGFQWGETEFIVAAIPLGGYVKMAGMEDDEAAEVLEGGAPAEPVPLERTFDHKPLWARTLVITAGVIMNFLFAVVVFTVIALAYGESLLPETRAYVPPAPAGAAAPLAAIPVGAKIVAIGGHPVATWNDVGRWLEDVPAGPVQLRFADAPPATIDLPAAKDARGELIGALQPFQDPVLGEVQGGSPASRAGLRKGDRVVEAGGQPVRSWPQLVTIIQGSPGRPLPMVVQRGAQRVPLTVTPSTVKGRKSAGERATLGRIGAGVQADVVHRRIGPIEAVGRGFSGTWDTTKFIATTLKQLVTGEMSARNMGGLLTIAEASGDSARMGFDAFLMFLALFSVNLAVLNLLPIPILDGGHLMFLLAEALRGRPLSVETRIRLSQVGLVIVVALMLWANGNDVVRWVERLVDR